MNKTLKKILVIMMALSLIATGLLGVSRARAERAARTVDIVLDYDEFFEMAQQSEMSFEAWMAFFSEQGVKHVALNEETLKSLKAQGKPLSYFTQLEFVSRSHWALGLPEMLISDLESSRTDRYDLVAETSDPELAAFIEAGLRSRVGPSFYKSYSNAHTTWFIIDGTVTQALFETGRIITAADGKVVERPDVYAGSLLDRIGIGYDTKKIEAVRDGGLEVLPRPINNPLNPTLALKAFEADFSAYGFDTSYIIYSGQEVIGYDGEEVMSMDRLIQSLDRLGLSTSLIEAGNQLGHVETRGADYVAENSQFNAVRVFPVVRYIQKRVGMYNYEGSEEIENTLYRAITERNIRSIYMRPFLENDRVYLTDQDEYERMFSSLERRLEAHGLTFGEPGIMAFNAPPLILKVVSAMGLAAAVVWLLAQLFRISLILGAAFAGLGTIGAAGALYIAPNLSTTLLGLSSSLIFPAVSVFILLDQLKKLYDRKSALSASGILVRAAALLVVTFVASFIGGYYVGGFLSSSSYLLEMEFFRGVKLSLGAPVAVAAVLYILKFGYGRKSSAEQAAIKSSSVYWKDLLAFLEASIKIKHIAILGAAGVVAYVYIARSGHETELQPSNLEMIFRNALEQMLLARPRTKEFLMAFPAVMMVTALAAKKKKVFILPLVLVASLGYSSIVNTFSHLRSPLYLSTARELYALGLGVLTGAAAVLLVLALDKWLIEGLYLKWQRSRDNEQA
ncbi:DUF5693 family protein [Acidaminobacter hydrogenoformans]|uniref:Uncharacterized protein n=1 Tax=Acidaminobacter hydrogenoformans DSM 2784 TaxID=1120920 RepID=A0A1G5S378_9FIRM|nr:DUF5693 family protein [Acidaminobacter hydrogenoformans]SCZ80783.1 hypothetical protein SAMN03080599_02446 [Acidaminobacter hydrogenoformans DSM 2784]